MDHPQHFKLMAIFEMSDQCLVICLQGTLLVFFVTLLHNLPSFYQTIKLQTEKSILGFIRSCWLTAHYCDLFILLINYF